MESNVIRLRGMDYFQVLIDHHIKKHGGTAHQARIFFHLEGTVSREEIEAVVRSDASISWICNLRLTYTRFHSYARIVTNSGKGEMPIAVVELEQGQEWESFIETHHSDLASSSPVHLLLFNFPDGRTGLLFTFNHILFDYQGIEQFLGGFSKRLDRPLIGNYIKTVGIRSRTNEFFHAIAYAFRKGGRAIFSTRKNPTSFQPDHIEFHTTSLSEDEVVDLKSCLVKLGLELQESIYLMAISAMVIYHQLGTAESRQQKMLFQLPVSTRTRKNRAGILFNALSFFYFNLDPQLMDDLNLVIKRLSGQMKEQINEGLPRAFLTFSDIYKVIPFKIYAWMLGLPTNGQLGSFNVSILGNTFRDVDQFMGRPIRDVKNFPSNTIQPGLTLVFYSFRGEFRMTTSWVKGEFDHKEQIVFHQTLKDGLLGLGVVSKGVE